MPEEVKFTEEEMKEIQTLQQSYLNMQNALGQISVARIRLQQQSDSYDKSESKIREDFITAQNNEKEFIEKINKKYGDGNLDITTGVFTPKEVEQNSDKPTPEDLKK